MPLIETPKDLAETIADMVGVYGHGPDGDHPGDCPCRICFVIEMAERIRASAENERRLSEAS